jgi:membrane protein
MPRKDTAGQLQWQAVVRRVYALDVAWRAANNYADHGGAVYAAAMSYYVLFALFPLLLFGLAVLGLLVRDPAIQERTVSAIVEQFPPEVNLRHQVEAVVAGVAERYITVLGLLGGLAALWTASAVFGTLRRALNRAFDVPTAQTFLRGKVVDLVSVLGMLGLVALSIAATAALALVRARADAYVAGQLAALVWGVAYFLVPFGLSFATFVLVYGLVPNRRVGLSHLWVGALLAAVGFEVAKAGFSLYVANFGRYQQVYGALGGAVIFLFFVFVVSNVVIFAAEVTSALAKDRAELANSQSISGRPGRAPAPPAHAGAEPSPLRPGARR